MPKHIPSKINIDNNRVCGNKNPNQLKSGLPPERGRDSMLSDLPFEDHSEIPKQKMCNDKRTVAEILEALNMGSQGRKRRGSG